MEINTFKNCQNCGSSKFKAWNQLSEDEKFVIGTLPDSSELSETELKKHHFCQRCLYISNQFGVNSPEC
jgi:hypothetical protein